MAETANARIWLVLLFPLLSVAIRLLFAPAEPRYVPDVENRLQQAESHEGVQFFGPESLAFDSQGRGPYTGVGDGRVLRWDGPALGWTEFCTTSPKRTSACVPKNPPVMDLGLEPLCGRPLGLRFDTKGNLYIADAYYGLNVVGPEGGQATVLTTQAAGVPIGFTNDVDLGADDAIYFTDSSTKFKKMQFALMFLHGDDSGRLLSYNLSSKETKVVLSGLHFPNGIAISQDKSYLLVCETLKQRVLRYWIHGAKAGKVEQFATLPGYPDNIRLTERGDYWVAIHARPNWVMRLPVVLRRALLKLPIPFASWYINMARNQAMGMVLRLSQDGEPVEALEDRQGKVAKLLSGVEERGGVLWLGSVVIPKVLKYRLQQ